MAAFEIRHCMVRKRAAGGGDEPSSAMWVAVQM